MRVRYAYVSIFDPHELIDPKARFHDDDLVWAEVEFDATGKGNIIEAEDEYIRSAIEKALRTPARYEYGELVDGRLATKVAVAQPGTIEHAELMASGEALLGTGVRAMPARL